VILDASQDLAAEMPQINLNPCKAKPRPSIAGKASREWELELSLNEKRG
jgi:hypothetical protein